MSKKKDTAKRSKKPKTQPISKTAEYDSRGKAICPACKERKFKILDCDSEGSS